MARGDIPVSVIIITKNEERNIEKCIRSVERFEDIHVVDSASTDRTKELAQAMGANIVDFRWNGKYPKKKQWSLDNLPFRHDWVLWVDADEEVYPELADEILDIIQEGPVHKGYFVSYDYQFMGRILKHGQRVYKLVFHDRSRARFIEQDDLDAKTSGDQEVHVQPSIDGTVGVLSHRMFHNDHDTLYHYFDRHNWYSDWEAVLRGRKLPVNSGSPQPGARGSLKKLFDLIPGKPMMVFVYSYLLKSGFRDGKAGFDYALSKAFYYWQIGIKVREFRANRWAKEGI